MAEPINPPLFEIYFDDLKIQSLSVIGVHPAQNVNGKYFELNFVLSSLAFLKELSEKLERKEIEKVPEFLMTFKYPKPEENKIYNCLLVFFALEYESSFPAIRAKIIVKQDDSKFINFDSDVLQG